jgi:hypothetical protein
MHQHPVFAKKHGRYTWCLHCERVFLTEDWVKNDWDCPGRGCDGGIFDASPWSKNDWPREVNENYPKVPVVGELYPLYGNK